MVIDEAAQAVELSTLIPLRYGCKQCVLVGDPKQLPATIMSRAAVEYGYSRSLFARLMDCGHPVVQLKLQVRSWHGLGVLPLYHCLTSACGCLCVASVPSPSCALGLPQSPVLRRAAAGFGGSEAQPRAAFPPAQYIPAACRV